MNPSLWAVREHFGFEAGDFVGHVEQLVDWHYVELHPQHALPIGAQQVARTVSRATETGSPYPTNAP